MAYVYIHRKKTNNEVFYVGFGLTQGDKYKRARDTYGRHQYWQNIYKKHGRIIEIVGDNLSVEDAEKLEIELIAKYGRRDLGKGPLVNLCDGGNVTIGYKAPQNVRDKFTNANRGERNAKAKLTREDVINIRKGYDKTDRYYASKTAKIYGVTYFAIRDILKGKNWNFDLAQPPLPTEKEIKSKLPSKRNAPKSPESVAKRIETMKAEGTFKRMGEARKGIPLSEEYKAKLRVPKTMTQELLNSCKENIEKARIKKMQLSQAGLLTTKRKGTKMTEEQKAKLRVPKTVTPALQAYWDSMKGKPAKPRKPATVTDKQLKYWEKLRAEKKFAGTQYHLMAH